MHTIKTENPEIDYQHYNTMSLFYSLFLETDLL